MKLISWQTPPERIENWICVKPKKRHSLGVIKPLEHGIYFTTLPLPISNHHRVSVQNKLDLVLQWNPLTHRFYRFKWRYFNFLCKPPEENDWNLVGHIVNLMTGDRWTNKPCLMRTPRGLWIVLEGNDREGSVASLFNKSRPDSPVYASAIQSTSPLATRWNIHGTLPPTHSE